MKYLDSSALVKLVVAEDETSALVEWLGESALVSSLLAAVEVPRAVLGAGAGAAAVRRADDLLARLHLRGLDGEVVTATRALPPGLRSLDAIHLATAQTLLPEVEEVVAYDRRLLEAATGAGVATASPGW